MGGRGGAVSYASGQRKGLGSLQPGLVLGTKGGWKQRLGLVHYGQKETDASLLAFQCANVSCVLK